MEMLLLLLGICNAATGWAHRGEWLEAAFGAPMRKKFEARNFATNMLLDEVQSIDTNHTSVKAEVASLQGVGTLTDGQAPSALNSVTGPRPSRIEVNHW